jgi:hypothetical protein
MNGEEVYRAATGTGQDPVTALLARAGLDEAGLPVISAGQVSDFLLLHLDAVQAARYPLRAEPLDGNHPGPSWVTVDAFPLTDGTGICVAYSFGQPDEDEMLTWAKVFREVAGPMPVSEVMAYARDWAERTHRPGG